MTCEACEGRGHHVLLDNPSSDGPFEYIAECEDCDGTGEWPDDDASAEATS